MRIHHLEKQAGEVSHLQCFSLEIFPGKISRPSKYKCEVKAHQAPLMTDSLVNDSHAQPYAKPQLSTPKPELAHVCASLFSILMLECSPTPGTGSCGINTSLMNWPLPQKEIISFGVYKLSDVMPVWAPLPQPQPKSLTLISTKYISHTVREMKPSPNAALGAGTPEGTQGSSSPRSEGQGVILRGSSRLRAQGTGLLNFSESQVQSAL